MKIVKYEDIQAPADKVWQVLAHDFDRISQWMSQVKHSRAIPASDGEAPMAGRICQFSDKPGGAYAEEKFVSYSEKDRSYTLEVVPKNMPAILPLRKNIARFKVTSLSERNSRVTMISHPDIKAHGYLLYPLLKLGLGSSFSQLLKELKQYCESR